MAQLKRWELVAHGTESDPNADVTVAITESLDHESKPQQV
jgi:hypothetical protein